MRDSWWISWWLKWKLTDDLWWLRCSRICGGSSVKLCGGWWWGDFVYPRATPRSYSKNFGVGLVTYCYIVIPWQYVIQSSRAWRIWEHCGRRLAILEVRDQALEGWDGLQSPPYLRYDKTEWVTNWDQSATAFCHPNPDNLLLPTKYSCWSPAQLT